MYTQFAYKGQTATSPRPKGETDAVSAGGGFQAPGNVLHFEQDQEIYGDGEVAGKIYKILSGCVRTCKFLSDGRRQIDAFYGPAEIFGLEAAGIHAFSAEAVCDCTVVAYRRHNFDGSAAFEAEPAGQTLALAMRSMERAQNHALLLGRRGATEKVIGFLIEWAAALGSNVLTLPMTRHDIADYLGLTTETVSRTLTQLERDKVLTLRASRLIVINDLAAFQRSAL